MKVLFLVFALVAATYSKRLFHNDQVLRLYPTEEQKIVVEQLSERYPVDFWNHPRGMHPVDVHVPKTYVAVVKVFLTRQRINYEVFMEDVQATIDASTVSSSGAKAEDGFDYLKFNTFEEISEWLDVISSEDLVTVITYGESYEGRALKAIQLSLDTGANKPSFVINCGLHSREWATPASCVNAVKWLLDDSTILQTIDIYVIPVSNPDGYVHTFTKDRMWRKTRSPNRGSICVGTDPNRNWDAAWGTEGDSNQPCSDLYRGPSAFSEAETFFQKEFVLGLKTVKAYIDVHAFYQYWMYPYGYTYDNPEDKLLLHDIGRQSIEAIKKKHNKVFTTGSIVDVIYPASGSSADFFYDSGIKCSFAAELRDEGAYGFIMPQHEILPSSEESFEGFMTIAKAVADHRCD